MRGVPQSGLWSEEEIASSGTGSERAQGRERSEEEAPREPLAPGITHGYVAEFGKLSPYRPGVFPFPASARISATPAANVVQSMRMPMAATIRHPAYP